MKGRKAHAGDRSGGDSKESEAVDAVEAEKQQLKTQINELRLLISQIESDADLTKFGDVKKSEMLPPLERGAYRRARHTNMLVTREIQRYVGFQCAKISPTDYVFYYKPYESPDQNDTYSVQIINKEGKGVLGSWVMPMSIDMSKILDNTPIENLSMVIPFLKNWILYIDCYVERKMQFCQLKDLVSDASNCTIDANLAFTHITIQLFGVYNSIKEIYINLTVYLCFKLNETRPCKTNVEWSLKRCPPKDEKDLKSYTKCLKSHSIVEGFKMMTETTHPVLSWDIEKHDDNPLELNDTSDSDEEKILERARRDRRKTQRRRSRTGSKAKSKKMRTEAQATDETCTYVNQSTSRSHSSRLEPENTVEDLLGTGRRLRQTTIDYWQKKSSSRVTKSPDNLKTAVISQEKAKKSPKKSSLSPKKILTKPNVKKANRAVTSTPLRKRLTGKVKFAEVTELSPIVSDEKEGN